MLGQTPAFSGFAVDDLAAARRFYEDVLGLRTSSPAEGVPLLTLHLAGEAGERPTLVYEKPDHTPATYTVLNFRVDDVPATVDALAARGVGFLRYDGFDQDERGISRREGGPEIAWFADPAGNVFAVLAGD